MPWSISAVRLGTVKESPCESYQRLLHLSKHSHVVIVVRVRFVLGRI